MSVQVQLHIKTEEMEHKHLQELGVVGGLLAQLQTDCMEEAHDLASEAPKFIVGSTTWDFAQQVLDLMQGVKEIDDTLIGQVEAIVENTDEDDAKAHRTVEWLEENKGEEVFAVGW